MCKRAQKEGYRARAAYKLKEIDESLPPHPARPGRRGSGLYPGRLEPIPAPPHGPARGGCRSSSTAPSLPWTCCPWSRSRACTIIQGDFREDAVLQQLEAVLQGRAGGRGGLRHGAQPQRAQQHRRSPGEPSDRAGSRFRQPASTASGRLGGQGLSWPRRLRCPGGACSAMALFVRVKPLKPQSSRAKIHGNFSGWPHPQRPIRLPEGCRQPRLNRRHRRPGNRLNDGDVRVERPKKSAPPAPLDGRFCFPGRAVPISQSLEPSLNNQWFSKVAVWLVIAMVLFTVFKQFDTRTRSECWHGRLLGLPERSPQRAHQERHHPGKSRGYGDRCVHPPMTGASAPRPPTWIAAWWGT